MRAQMRPDGAGPVQRRDRPGADDVEDRSRDPSQHLDLILQELRQQNDLLRELLDRLESGDE